VAEAVRVGVAEPSDVRSRQPALVAATPYEPFKVTVTVPVPAPEAALRSTLIVSENPPGTGVG